VNAPPLASLAPERRSPWTWILPLGAIVFALFLVRRAWAERGPAVLVHAEDGRGLEAGDPLRYRGIEVGRVEALELGAAGDVLLHVRLARSASALARAGTRFWIARPVLGVEGVRGLETALGARYLAVLPAAGATAPQGEFVALEEPPLAENEDPGALEVVLLADTRDGLARGAPVLFRGLAIGALASVGLSSDATAVEVRARIQAPYAELVRSDSRFYRTRGASLSLGLGGLELAVDSLQSLWLGGVALATPTQAGARASTGARFELAREPEEEWLAWRPALPVGSALAAEAAQLPRLVAARLGWRAHGWFARQRSRSGWLVREAGSVLGPADLLVAPEGAEEAFLELGGERVSLAAPPEWTSGPLACRALPGGAPAPAERRALTKAEDLLLCADPALAPMAVAAAHLEHDAEGWRLAPLLTLDERWHGAAVLAREDGRWVGLLLVADGQGRIADLPGP